MATYLVARTANDFTPAYYLMAVALVSFVATLGLPETAGQRRDRTPADVTAADQSGVGGGASPAADV